jgi:hypothetical protein
MRSRDISAFWLDRRAVVTQENWTRSARGPINDAWRPTPKPAAPGTPEQDPRIPRKTAMRM